MNRSLVVLVPLLSVIAFGSNLWAQAVPQELFPIENFTESKDRVNEVYVSPTDDLSHELEADARLDLPDGDVARLLGAPAITPGGPVAQPFIQRLRGRTFVMIYNVFSSLVYQGDNGLVMVDCGGHFGEPERARLLAGLQLIGGWDGPTEVGDGIPLRALVVTHPHADHSGNSLFLKQLFPRLKIVASRWYADEVRVNRLPLARPGRYTTIRRRFGHFFFEGKRFTFNTPVRSAHTTADSYIITPDKVLMAVDFVQADRLPFIEVSVTRDLFGYIHFLRYLMGEAAAGNWEVASWGHFNVGYPRDVQMSLDHLEALFQAWTLAFLGNPIEAFIDPSDPFAETNIAVPLNNFFDQVAADLFFGVAELPRPDRPGRTWGEHRFAELGRDHADRVHEMRFLSLFNSFEFDSALQAGGIPAVIDLLTSRIPSFDPIPPGRRLYF